VRVHPLGPKGPTFGEGTGQKKIISGDKNNVEGGKRITGGGVAGGVVGIECRCNRGKRLNTVRINKLGDQEQSQRGRAKIDERGEVRKSSLGTAPLGS